MVRVLRPVLFGMLGMGLTLMAWHVWQDHQDFHRMRLWVAQVQQQAAAAAQATEP